jgi:hypothetical protein
MRTVEYSYRFYEIGLRRDVTAMHQRTRVLAHVKAWNWLTWIMLACRWWYEERLTDVYGGLEFRSSAAGRWAEIRIFNRSLKHKNPLTFLKLLLLHKILSLANASIEIHKQHPHETSWIIARRIFHRIYSACKLKTTYGEWLKFLQVHFSFSGTCSH